MKMTLRLLVLSTCAMLFLGLGCDGDDQKQSSRSANDEAPATRTATEDGGESYIPPPVEMIQTPGELPPPPDDPNLAPVELALPRPVFIGTPKNIPPGTTVAPPSPHPRAPFYAPKGVANVATGKPITAGDSPIMGMLEQIADGDAEAAESSAVVFGPGKSWVQIDLGAVHSVYAIIFWHQHNSPVVYHDVVVKLASDPDMIDTTTVFNNDQDNSIGEGVGKDREYFETHEGKLIDCKGVHGRYVRLFSNGSTDSQLNQMTEVMVFVQPAD